MAFIGKSMKDRYIIVGAGWAGRAIASVLVDRNPEQVIGFAEDNPISEKVVVSNGNGGCELPVLGHSKNLIEIVKKHNSNAVIIAITHNRADHVLREIVKCFQDGVPVYEMPDLYSRITHKIPIEHVRHQWIVPHLSVPENNFYRYFHVACSYLVSFIGFFCIFLPLFPFVAAAITMNSRGPVFYRQDRVGKKRKNFKLLKFRTMFVDAENGKAQWARKDDLRITGVGRFLRRYRLDELPQFINVLMGDMSLIGPRPERPEFVEGLAKKIPFYNYRHLVHPGITGWAQVNYRYGNSVRDALEKLQYDLYWIRNRSFWLDLKIIFKSIKVVLTGFGAV